MLWGLCKPLYNLDYGCSPLYMEPRFEVFGPLGFQKLFYSLD